MKHIDMLLEELLSSSASCTAVDVHASESRSSSLSSFDLGRSTSQVIINDDDEQGGTKERHGSGNSSNSSL